ncbi:MAG: ATP-dependent DNA helicase [Pseudomonadota bacterium]
MSQSAASQIPASIALPDIPVLYANTTQAVILTTDGEIKIINHETVKQLIYKKPVLTCHAPYVRSRLNCDDMLAFDLLELFAFVHPGKFCIPTPVGLAQSIDVNAETSLDDIPIMMMDCAKALLSDLQHDPWRAKADPIKIANVMGQQGDGWNWTPFVFSALGEKYRPEIPVMSKVDLNTWKNLPEWAEEAPLPLPSHEAVTGEESREQLASLLGQHAEKREQQMQYTTALTSAFAPIEEDTNPNVVVAEAGTGVGKTLGYLAPASVWAEKNKGTVWISTYTKNLQKQVNEELDKLYPHPDLKKTKVAIRKGRENYLCLLNMEEAAAGAGLSRNPRQAISLGIMARWIAATEDGDVTSGTDFPGWLSNILGHQYTNGLADRRGECIYSACDHYHRCFVEQSVRKAKHAQLVVANHALVMIQTAINQNIEDLPLRYVFDEGHHLFDAADSAFAGHLTARETYDTRRWLRGTESARKSRLRGLKSRAEDLVSGDEKMDEMLKDILEKSRCLTADGWQKRLRDNQPKGPCEEFILDIYAQVMARVGNNYGPYSLETETFPLTEALPPKIRKLKFALKDLQKPMLALADALRKKLVDHADTLESDTRKRIDAVQSGLERRAHMNIGAWISMLDTLLEGKSPEEFIDWMEIERIEGRTWDIGLYRHWVDPMVPFAAAIKPQAHGVAITSATLRDGSHDEEKNWETALQRSGAKYLSDNPVLEKYSSPFNYQEQTKIFVINDVRKDDMDQVASAYEALLKASNGGAIGLFTAISRLKTVQEKITTGLSHQNIPLYAQHVDAMDTGTLIDIFRNEEDACLLGTDAIRDGVDVPGNSLRMLVFDRVPWPRPNIMHKRRRGRFGGKNYDDMLTRLKLKQAYGRLIRRNTDKGVFVMMDSMMPSRLAEAFPENVEIERVGISEACTKIKEFLNNE